MKKPKYSIAMISRNTPQWLKEIRAKAKRKGLDKLTMREINQEIRAARKESGKGK